MSQMTFNAETTATVKSLFEAYGVTWKVYVVAPVTEDEAIFVVPTIAAATMDERGLTQALTELLHRKVWVATDGPEWTGKTVPLDQ